MRKVLWPIAVRVWKIIMPILVVTSSITEIASFWINHQSYILTNFERLSLQLQLAWYANPEYPNPGSGSTLQEAEPGSRSFSAETATGECTRYAYYKKDPDCGSIGELPKRLLCEISLAPVEKVCAARAPAG